MEFLNKKQKIIFIIIVIFVLLFIGYYIIAKANNSEYIELETEENSIIEENKISEEDEIVEKRNIIVHIIGAVNKEGIVQIEEGSRISDVIEKAGGATKKADLSKINLAYIVQDGQKIYVPNIDDKEEVTTVTEDAGNNIIKNEENTEKKININTATQTELETLSGIGPSTALKIINYRIENGNFKKIEDLKNVPGIGDAKFENIRKNICVK